MTNLAVDIRKAEVTQQIGVVTHVAGKTLGIRAGASALLAGRAKSCLVEPTPGDTVLVAVASSGRAWVLAVLEGAEGDATRLSIDGDLDLSLNQGRFTVTAPEGVGVVSGKDVSVVSGQVQVNAVEGGVVLERLSFFSRYVYSEVEKLKSFATTIDRVAERVTERVKRSYRTVEELDRVQARQIDMTADQVMSLRAGNAVVTAEKLVKIDGEQIHVG